MPASSSMLLPFELLLNLTVEIKKKRGEERRGAE